MSTNIFSRLKALLPTPPLWVSTVVAHNTDGTSSVELPSGLASISLGPGLAAGATLRVRGTQVPVGSKAFIRDGAIESAAPSGSVVEAVIGTVADLPFGPARLALGADIVGGTAATGVAYSLDINANWTGGYAPRTYALTAGTLPPGLALGSVTGLIAGTRTSGSAATGLVVTCTDSTNRAVASAAFSIG